VYGDFQSGKQGKSNGIQYVDQHWVNVRRLPDLENCLIPFPTLLRGTHGSFSMGNRNPGMFEVRSPRIGKLHMLGSIPVKESGFRLALSTLYASGQAGLSQADPLRRSTVVHFLGQGNDCFQVPHRESVLHGPSPLL
jgi:hypothetical protein